MLKIHRVNKKCYQVRDGKEIIVECSSYKEAMNALISEDIRRLDDLEEWFSSDIEDFDLSNLNVA